MNSQLPIVDLVVLIVYMVSVFGLGCWFARKSGATQEFMVAGRSLPGWAVGLSIFGTYVSTIAFLGNTGKAFAGNWNSWTFGLSLPISGIIAVRWFVPFYRQGDQLSTYAHLEARFGPWARLYAMVCFLLAQLGRVGTILYLAALALAPLTGWDVRTIIYITGILVTVYTLLGGIEAVIWTDVAQSIVLMAGAVLCAVLVLTGMPEGPGQLFSIARQHDKFSLGSFAADVDSLIQPQPSFWIVLVYGILINLLNFGINQNFVQRYFTARSDRDAAMSVWVAVLLFPVVSTIFFFLGAGLFSLYQTDAELMDDIRKQVAEAKLLEESQTASEAAIAAKAKLLTAEDLGDKVLPHFIVNRLPTGLAGLLIAAIFAAAMSSIDTSLNSSATVFFCDIYQRSIRPTASEKESMRVLHGFTLFMGVAGTIAAVAMLGAGSALDVWWKLQGAIGGGTLGLFLLGMISRRSQNAHAAFALTLGVLLILWMTVSTMDIWPESLADLANPLHGFLTIVCGTALIVILGVVPALILPNWSSE